jgi:hypothetical protein
MYILVVVIMALTESRKAGKGKNYSNEEKLQLCKRLALEVHLSSLAFLYYKNLV